MMNFYLTACRKFLLKLNMASKTLSLTGVNFSQQPGNYDTSILSFTNYKDPHIGKALIGISPTGMRLIFTGIDPGSICDSNITKKSDVISCVEEEHEIILDKEFAFQNICTQIGYLRKIIQFSVADVAAKFDIAATSIHDEKIAGLVCEWSKLNNVQLIRKTNFLTSTWRILCHIVILLFPQIILKA